MEVKGMKMKNMMMAVMATTILVVAGSAGARIKLSALPQRERVEIQLDNGFYTLVE